MGLIVFLASFIDEEAIIRKRRKGRENERINPYLLRRLGVLGESSLGADLMVEA